MDHATNYQIVDLSSSDFHSYLPFILPEAHFLFQKPLETTTHLTAIEARCNNQLVGLIIAYVSDELRRARIRSWFVIESKRGQGIGQALLERMQNQLVKAERCGILVVEYEKSIASAPIIEKIFKHLQWDLPQLYFIRCHFDAQSFNPAWYQNQMQRPAPVDMELFAWNKLTEAERQQIEHEQLQGAFLSAVGPFQDEEQIEPLTSFGVRHQGKVIGWCICHRRAQDQASYASFYVAKQFQHTGVAIWLLAHSIQINKAHHALLPRVLFEINLQQVDRSWWLFVRKRLIPYAIRIERIKQALQVFKIDP
jgi:GNAT superfamily N-acetyltransferase